MGAPDIWSSKFVVSGCCPGTELDGAQARNRRVERDFRQHRPKCQRQIAEAEGRVGFMLILHPFALILSGRLTADG